MNNECLQLSSSHPGQNAAEVSATMEEVHTAWESLQAATSGRKRKLKSSLELQKFLLSVSVALIIFYSCFFELMVLNLSCVIIFFQIHDLVSWMKDTATQITSEESVTSVASAKEHLDSHNLIKAEIDAREDSIQKITRAGNRLIQQGHYAKSDVSIITIIYDQEEIPV